MGLHQRSHHFVPIYNTKVWYSLSAPLLTWRSSSSLFSNDQNNRNAFIWFQRVLTSSSLKYCIFSPFCASSFSAWLPPLEQCSATICTTSFSVLWENVEVSPTGLLKEISTGQSGSRNSYIFILIILYKTIAWHRLSSHIVGFLVWKSLLHKGRGLKKFLTLLTLLDLGFSEASSRLDHQGYLEIKCLDKPWKAWKGTCEAITWGCESLSDQINYFISPHS